MPFLEPQRPPAFPSTALELCLSCNQPQPCSGCVTTMHLTHNEMLRSAPASSESSNTKVCTDCGHLLAAFKPHKRGRRGQKKQCSVPKHLWNKPCTDINCSLCAAMKLKYPDRAIYHKCACSKCVVLYV